MNKENSEQLRKHLARLVKGINVEKIVKSYEHDNTPAPASDAMAMRYVKKYEDSNTGTQIYFPENTDAIKQWLAKFFGFDDFVQLRRADADLFSKVSIAIMDFRDWRGGYIWMSAFEEKYPIELAGRLIYKAIAPKLTETQKNKKMEAYKQKYDRWDANELKASLHIFLQTHRLEEFTQDDLSREFCAKSDFLYHRLLELVQAGDTIITYNSRRYPKSHKNYKNEQAKVYKYAPERVEILRDFENIDAHMQNLLLRCVGKNPGLSQNQIVEKMVIGLGQIDEKVVRRNLLMLVEKGQIERQAVKCKNAHKFYLPSALKEIPASI